MGIVTPGLTRGSMGDPVNPESCVTEKWFVADLLF
jgi:hypothetical protein